MGHHYPDLAAHGHDSISYATLSFVRLSFICAEKGGNVAPGRRIDTFEYTFPVFFHRRSFQRDYVTRRRAIVLALRQRENLCREPAPDRFS